MVSGDEVAFEHCSDDGGVASGALADDFFEDGRHVFGLLATVRVGGIDHDAGGELVFEEGVAGGLDGIAIEIGTVFAASENEVAVGISGSRDSGGDALIGDAEESLREGGCLDGVDSGSDIARGGIFKTERHREAGGHLAVSLAFGGAGADGGPGDEVGNVLRGDGVEELGGSWEAETQDVGEELAGDREAFVDVVGPIEVGVHDEALPAHGGAGFLEVDAHDDEDFFFHFLSERGELFGVGEARGGVVNGAGTDDEDESGVGDKKRIADCFA